VTVSDGTRDVRLISDPTDRSFWDPQLSLPETNVCVFVNGKPLHCENGTFAKRDDGSLIHAEWPLFLKPRFGADTWTVRVEQPRSIAMAAVHSFRVTLPVVAGIAILGALLLSFTHLRRMHHPLAMLVAAARRMSRGRFDQPVQIVSDDEFASVGRAFNRLASRLKRQLGLLSTLSRIDRQILAHPTFEPVVLTLLPRIPRLIGCRAAAVLLEATPTAAAQLLFYRAGSGRTVERIAIADGADPFTALESVCPWIGAWQSSPIVVDGHRRGVLVAGQPGDAEARPSSPRRQLAGVAHRLAVALGNEDRERELVRQSYFDPLTSLPNRQLFLDRLEQELLRSRREFRSVALLYFDLDHFKNFNDSLGHSAGDALLRDVAGRLRTALREGDTLSRLGGDEFTIIAPATNPEVAAALATRALALLREPFVIDEVSYIIQASVGIAQFPRDAAASQEMLRCANVAMYRAKQNGRGRLAHFEESMNARVQRRMLVEQRLRLAVDQHQLTLAFQPKQRSQETGRRGFEALARWTDAELGVVSPGEFIPLAEECGLIGRIGAFALQETCRRLVEWRTLGLPIAHVAVNVSALQLRDAQYPEFVLQTLAAFSVPHSMLHLEITESMLAHDDALVIRHLEQLRAAGIRIAMDDFGTGYSSLASLRDLPIDVLKIDRSFVLRSCDSAADEALLGSLIELAHTLGKLVVAEGVETVEQLRLLRALGCDAMQGFLLGRPMPAEDVPAYLDQIGARATTADADVDEVLTARGRALARR